MIASALYLQPLSPQLYASSFSLQQSIHSCIRYSIISLMLQILLHMIVSGVLPPYSCLPFPPPTSLIYLFLHLSIHTSILINHPSLCCSATHLFPSPNSFSLPSPPLSPVLPIHLSNLRLTRRTIHPSVIYSDRLYFDPFHFPHLLSPSIHHLSDARSLPSLDCLRGPSPGKWHWTHH